jgi:transposase
VPNANAIKSLPDDVQLLKEMIILLQRQLIEKDQDLEALRHSLDALKRRYFGARADRISDDQLLLFAINSLGLSAEAPAQPEPAHGTEAPPKAIQKNGHGRRSLSDKLPRERVVIPNPAAGCPCSNCGTAMVKIGEEVSEVVERVPATVKVIEYVRERHACPLCAQGGVTISPMPEKPIERSPVGFGLLAYILVSKFADHLPLNRLMGMFLRDGFDVPISTLIDWTRQGIELLAPIVLVMRKELLEDFLIHTDDTGQPVIVEKQPKTHPGHLWIYVGMTEAGGYSHAVFAYTKTRSGQGPATFLNGYSGFVCADAFSGYNALFQRPHGLATEVGCWAHGRRGFVDAQSSYPAQATEALAIIKMMFAVEHEADALKLDVDGRLALRKEKSAPLVAKLRARLDEWGLTTLPKSGLGKAITYANNQWKPLVRFLEDGRVPLTNNIAELGLRGPVIGRKNWLFAGSHGAAERIAIIESLIVSCRLHKVDPMAYITDVLRRVSSHPASRVRELTPMAWAAAYKTSLQKTEESK